MCFYLAKPLHLTNTDTVKAAKKKKEPNGNPMKDAFEIVLLSDTHFESG